MLEQELTLEQKRLLSLLDYLEALEKLHRQPVFQISEHGGFAAYQKEILGLPSVELNELDETGQVWLSIERLRPRRPPRLPEALTVWVSIKDDPASPPKCRPVIKLNPKNELRIEDHPEIAAAFDAYVEQSWRPWSETELPRRRTITLYDKLFNLKQAIESEGTESPSEVAWGVGIVVWNRERKIQYPLLTQLVEIDHIGADMAIRIRPREVEPRLELDPYHELENPGAPILEKRARAILQQAEATMSPFDPASFEEILASAAATLDPQGKYWPRECEQSDAALPSASAELRVTDSWVLFARRKSTSFLVEDVRRLKEAVKSQSVFDGGPKVLVEDPTGPAVERRQFSYRGVSSPGISSEGGLEIRNLYFPRPFNKEQVAIVEKLDQADGVVVQGPPGTGKTHTISNIICHYLALGKRVLVTSKGESALAVLQDQIPSTVRPLTISLLTNEREGLKQLERFDPAIPALVEELFPGVFKSAVITSDEREMNRLANALRLHLSRNRLSAAQKTLDAQKRRVKVCRGELFDAMRAFLDSPGCVDVSEQSVQERWSSFIEELTRLRTQEPHFQTVLRVTSLIEQSGGGAWAQRLQQRPATEDDDTEVPSHWRESWQWSRQKGYLRDLDGRVEIARLNGERRRAEHDLARANEHVVEQLTWLKLREALDQDRSLMAALQQYMAAIRSIGTGTGVRAIRYRRDARRAMEKANQAIRCWIMPHWRISETLPSELASFDLVILDEASQSDLWALPALLRAKKILVVGDNKQVSPSVIGLKEADIRNLHRKFLSTLPYGDVMTPEKSIYDLAGVLFASDLVRLREHFRCVESIIQFSNRLCYNNEIRCLRVPTATERLSPTLIDVFVRGGYRHAGSRKINLPEAEAIVAEIKRIVTDPAFEKRTLGVVSLLGSEQARVILERLVSEIGEEKVLKHQIRCESHGILP